MSLANLYMKHFPEASMADLHFFMTNWGFGVRVPHYIESLRELQENKMAERRILAEDWIYKNSKILNKNNMENFSESDKEFLDMTQKERKNLASVEGSDEPCMSELNGPRIDFPEPEGSVPVADGVKSGLGKVYDEAEGLTKEAFEAAMPKITSKSLADIAREFGDVLVRRYRKKPVVIDAVEYKSGKDKVQDSVIDWIRENGGMASYDGDKLMIETLEGPITASVGDYIIRGVNGEFYPCKPDIFSKTYELAEKYSNEDLTKGNLTGEIREGFKGVDYEKLMEQPGVSELKDECPSFDIQFRTVDATHDLVSGRTIENFELHVFMSYGEFSKRYVYKVGHSVSAIFNDMKQFEIDAKKPLVERFNENNSLPKVPSNDEMIYESYHMLVELTEKKKRHDIVVENLDETLRNMEWENMVKNASREEMEKSVNETNEHISNLVIMNPDFPVELLSDGYHTFKELYEFRMLYNAALFNEWAKGYGVHYGSLNPFNVHKSWKHHDGEPCFGGGWFIVSAMLPTGLISNHYEGKYWDYFKVPEAEKALFRFDGHTSEDVQKRLTGLILGNGPVNG